MIKAIFREISCQNSRDRRISQIQKENVSTKKIPHEEEHVKTPRVYNGFR